MPSLPALQPMWTQGRNGGLGCPLPALFITQEDGVLREGHQLQTGLALRRTPPLPGSGARVLVGGGLEEKEVRVVLCLGKIKPPFPSGR